MLVIQSYHGPRSFDMSPKENLWGLGKRKKIKHYQINQLEFDNTIKYLLTSIPISCSEIAPLDFKKYAPFKRVGVIHLFSFEIEKSFSYSVPLSQEFSNIQRRWSVV